MKLPRMRSMVSRYVFCGMNEKKKKYETSVEYGKNIHTHTHTHTHKWRRE